MEKLFEQHSEKLFTYLRQHAQSREDAEDILVETFTAALAETKFTQLPETAQIGWLWRVARNKVVDAIRKATFRRNVPLELADETACEDDAGNPEQMALRQDAQHEIHALLHSLPQPQQDILQLRFAHDLHSGEIAAILGKRDDAVRAMLSRAMNTLRHLYIQRSSLTRHSKPDQSNTTRMETRNGDSK